MLATIKLVLSFKTASFFEVLAWPCSSKKCTKRSSCSHHFKKDGQKERQGKTRAQNRKKLGKSKSRTNLFVLSSCALAFDEAIDAVHEPNRVQELLAIGRQTALRIFLALFCSPLPVVCWIEGKKND